MIIAFESPELPRVRSALNVMCDLYTELALKEIETASRADLLAHRETADKMLDRFRVLFGGPSESFEVELTPGDFAVLERALRMSAAKWQAMIRPQMTAKQKAEHREQVEEVNNVFTKLRKARGLPW